MSSLNNRDLERFSWEKMAPGIEEKIQRKKRKAFFFRWRYIGFMVFVLFLLMWGIQLTQTSDDTLAVDQINKEQIVLPIKENTSDKESSTKDLSIVKEDNHDLPQNEEDLQLNNHLRVSEKNIADPQNVSNSKKQVKQALKQDVNNIKLFHSHKDVIKRNTNFEEPKAGETNNVKLTVNEKKHSKADENHFHLANENSIDTLDDRPEVSTQLLKSYVFQLNNRRYEVEKYASIVVDNDWLNRIRGVQAIELSYNINLLTRHPHLNGLGNGYALGYWFKIGGQHYAGFEYKYQNLRYQFFNNTEQSYSDNVHNMYNIPFYYAYKLHVNRTSLVLETGLNLNVVRQSKGQISAVNNVLAIFNIEEENYFNRRVNTSLIFRAKIEQPIYGSLGLFLRGGVDIANSNWYKDDSFEIKPIVYSIDFGTYVKF